ncbi:hypothetical protein BAUCODRAFT_145840 [Baudoinia panamericana UAMH 10762]|uniref:PEBP-like protein n=1 Tax=Baudoinia panamericana (strain UAMH 10762) TaxID=717646 RepID=M2NIA2_BAUPA|nr:uncharacterized protein BAUCODRAFT_145840 [Baudoinia panamericana UAMH 10762]EMC98820.1 hypothetical protein BAUCODRAFT_145840 [Baudoinia panamericana UAMH 10762]
MHMLNILALVATVTAAALPNGAAEKRTTTCSTASSASLAAAKAAFTQAKLVPDLIPSFNPEVTVSASFGGKAVKLGNTFNPVETIPEPSISFTAEPGYDPSNTKYTIFLVDPDAPGPAAPIFKDFLHIIIANAQPSCVTSQTRTTLASYQLLTPLSIAAHRYTILVYRQPPNYTPPVDIHYLPGVRNNFDLNGYVAEAGLIGPVGGNYFMEGLAQAVCLVTPNCTSDGTGYPLS